MQIHVVDSLFGFVGIHFVSTFYSAFLGLGCDKFVNIWARARVRARIRLRAMPQHRSAVLQLQMALSLVLALTLVQFANPPSA